MIRRLLDGLYRASGYVSALFLAGIAGTILAQIVGRFIYVVIDMTEVSGFCLAASTFFGLAYSFRSGSHIRIDLAIRHATGMRRRLLEVWCYGVCLLLAAFFTVYSARFFLTLFKYGDESRGLIAVPLWIPVSAMVIGLMALTIAIADKFVCIVLGGALDGQDDGAGVARDKAGRPERSTEASRVV
jgi:TRAP-type C4-dicarboxylate transport system permease small subunit